MLITGKNFQHWVVRLYCPLFWVNNGQWMWTGSGTECICEAASVRRLVVSCEIVLLKAFLFDVMSECSFCFRPTHRLSANRIQTHFGNLWCFLVQNQNICISRVYSTKRATLPFICNSVYPSIGPSLFPLVPPFICWCPLFPWPNQPSLRPSCYPSIPLFICMSNHPPIYVSTLWYL